MRKASIPLALGLALWVAASASQAMGFGRVGNTTQLGQPLNFAAVVNLEPDESLARECVSAEVVSGENKVAAAQVRVTLEESATPGERHVRVTTSSLIDEPVVSVSVTVGCTAKITRTFVAFIDPPVIGLAQTSPGDPSLMTPQRVDSQVAPLLAIVQGAAPAASAPDAAPRARAERRAARATSAKPPAVAVAAAGSGVDNGTASPPPKAKSKPPAAARRPRTATASASAAPGPRLQLEAAAPIVALAASAVASAPASAAAGDATAASAPRTDEQAEALARERLRIQALEEGMSRLRAESAASQQALVALQARLQQAESERYANPLVYVLALLVLLLAVGLVLLWWRQSGVNRGGAWWVTPAESGAAPAADDTATDRRDEAASAALFAPVDAVDTQPHVVAEAPALPLLPELEIPPLQGPRTVSMPAVPSAEPQNELSVEELIDLEQQADFFIVLGQDEAAIDLLMSHVRSSGGTSPLPYLKLLEIYRRRGDADAYDRIRERFNRRFRAYAPDWASDLQRGLSLEDYPEISTRLQSLWSSPELVMQALDASLFRRDAGEQTFDLPAYRELLFLYSIARDLSEHAASDMAQPTSNSMDLLLPIDSETRAARTTQSLFATTPMPYEPSDPLTMPLDLDLDLAMPLDLLAENRADTPTAASPESQPDTAPPSLEEPSNFLGLVDPMRLRGGN